MIATIPPRIKTLLLIALAAFMLYGGRLAQDRFATGTALYCQAELAYTYACHVWFEIYRGGRE
jgi:hypothetical protein